MLDISNSAAAGEFESAKVQLEDLRRFVDTAQADGTLDEQGARTIHAAIDSVNKALDDMIRGDNEGKGKGPKNQD